MSDANTEPAPHPGAVNRRNLMVALGIWVALVAAALGLAAAMNTTPEPAQSAIPEGLPPLRLYLDRGLPPSVEREATTQDQLIRLQEIANTDSTGENWTNLGAAYHFVGNLQEASLIYQRALSIDPNRLDARIGTILIDAYTGGRPGLDRAGVAMDDLAAANPDSQLVAFNQAMVATYRSDRETLVSALDRAVALDPKSRLGVLATQLREAAGP